MVLSWLRVSTSMPIRPAGNTFAQGKVFSMVKVHGLAKSETLESRGLTVRVQEIDSKVHLAVQFQGLDDAGRALLATVLEAREHKGATGSFTAGEVRGDRFVPGLADDLVHHVNDGGVVVFAHGGLEGGGDFLHAGALEDADVLFPVGIGRIGLRDLAHHVEPLAYGGAGQRQQPMPGQQVFERLILGIGFVKLRGAFHLQGRRHGKVVVLAIFRPRASVPECGGPPPLHPPQGNNQNSKNSLSLFHFGAHIQEE